MDARSFEYGLAILEVTAFGLALAHVIGLHRVEKGFSKVEIDLSKVEGDLSTVVNDQLSTVAKGLSKVEQELSTRGIGRFPEYVGEITKLIDSATKELLVVCDYPGFCIFSGYELWLNCERALREAVARVPRARIIWLDQGRRADVLREQFKVADEDAKQWKAIDRRQELLEKFVKNYKGYMLPSTTAENITYGQFSGAVEAVHLHIAKSLASVEPKELKERPNLYFWIAECDDGVRAVFAIPNYTDREEGSAFVTSDPNIISGLRSIYTRLDKIASSSGIAAAA